MLVVSTLFFRLPLDNATCQQENSIQFFPTHIRLADQCFLSTGCSQITCIDAGPLRANGNNGDRYKSDLCSNSRPQLYLQLQYIDLTDCVSLEDSGIQMIVRSCAQLTCIYLRRCVHITGKENKKIDEII